MKWQSREQLESGKQPACPDPMESVLEMLNEGVIIANENRRKLFANSRFVEMSGINRERITSPSLRKMYLLL